MQQPTKKQIKEYVEFINGMSILIGEFKFKDLTEEKQKELQTVGKWLHGISQLDT